MTIAEEKYVALTTYRNDGTSSSVPIWIADLGDGTLGFTTYGQSIKAKRLRSDSRIKLEPCDARGRVRDATGAVAGRATLSPEHYGRINGAIKEKYGWQVPLIRAFYALKGLFGTNDSPDTGVLVALD